MLSAPFLASLRQFGRLTRISFSRRHVSIISKVLLIRSIRKNTYSICIYRYLYRKLPSTYLSSAQNISPRKLIKSDDNKANNAPPHSPLTHVQRARTECGTQTSHQQYKFLTQFSTSHPYMRACARAIYLEL